MLKDKRVDPSDKDNYAIRWASYNGHLEVVKVLLKDKRVDPSEYKNDAIQFASRLDHLEVVKALLKDKRVDPSDVDNYAIREASKYGYLEVVKLLLKNPRVYNTYNGILKKHHILHKRVVLTKLITKWKKCMKNNDKGICNTSSWWFNKGCIQYIFENQKNKIIYILRCCHK